MAQSAVLIESGASLALVAGLAAYVAFHRPHTALHRLMVAILAAVACWDMGTLIRWAGGDPMIGACVMYTGVSLAPPLFLALVLRCVPWAPSQERAGAVLAGLVTVGALFAFGFITNPIHHLLITTHSYPPVGIKPAQWSGPLFELFTVWSHLCVSGGIAIALYASCKVDTRIERRRLRILGFSACVPAIANLLFLHSSYVTIPVTPGALAITSLAWVVAIVRYRFLERWPLSAREVIRHLRDGLVITDRSGWVIDANPAAEALLGHTLEEMSGIELATLADELDPTGQLVQRLAGSKPTEFVVCEVERHNGRLLEVSAGWMTGRYDEPAGRFVLLSDRTELHRLDRLRGQSQRLESVGALAAGIAHEINNPLSFVSANLGELRRYIEQAHTSSERVPDGWSEGIRDMRELIEESLEGVSRIGAIVAATRRLSREPSQSFEPEDLAEIAAEALRFAQFPESVDVGFEVDDRGGSILVKGDRDRLGQVILNLLVNARQAVSAAERGSVRIAVRATDDHVEASVHDNGNGVPPELGERVFDPFFTTKGPEQGTGLGLAIAFDIVREHDGTIEVGPSDLGGACFTVRLPRA